MVYEVENTFTDTEYAFAVQLAYVSIAVSIISFLEILVMYGIDIHRKGQFRKGFTKVNNTMSVCLMGIIILHINRAISVFQREYNNYHGTVQAFGTGVTVLGQMTFLYYRNHILMGTGRVNQWFRVLLVIVAICTVATTISAFFLWRIRTFKVVIIFYGIESTAILIFDIYFAYLFAKQLRELKSVLGVKDRQMSGAARMGIIIIIAGLLSTFAAIARIVIPDSYYNLQILSSFMTFHFLSLIGHVVLFSKLKVFKSLRTHSNTRHIDRTKVVNSSVMGQVSSTFKASQPSQVSDVI